MARGGTYRSGGGVRRSELNALEDLAEGFSRAPLLLPVVMAGAIWGLSILILPKNWIPLGIGIAVVVLAAGIGGWIQRWRRRGLLTRSRTEASIRDLSWREFEDLLVELFNKEGYQVQKTSPGTDGGVDHIIRKDGEIIFVQAKHWNARQVPLSVVQRTYGVAKAGRASPALVVTGGRFSPEAKTFARDVAPELQLVDGDQLLQRLREHGLAEGVRGLLPSKAETLPEAAIESCPECGAQMVRKTGRYGPFLSCVRFPACRGSRPPTPA